MVQKAMIRIGIIGDGEKTVALSKKALVNVIGALLSECESIETEIRESMCIVEKSRLMNDYQSLTVAYQSLSALEECL